MTAIDIDDTTHKSNTLGSYSRVSGGTDLQLFKKGIITADNTTDDGNTIAVDIFKRFGMTRFEAIIGYIHTTEDSVIVEEAPTTSVNGNILTITVGGSTDNKKRVYVIYGV